mgnify:CR=1 FL=1
MAWAPVSDSPGLLSREVFQDCPSGGRFPGKTPGHTGVSMSLPPRELVEVSGEREVWADLYRLLPL